MTLKEIKEFATERANIKIKSGVITFNNFDIKPGIDDYFALNDKLGCSSQIIETGIFVHQYLATTHTYIVSMYEKLEVK